MKKLKKSVMKRLTTAKENGNIVKLSARNQAKTQFEKFFKKVKKSVKKCLTLKIGLWYDIQAVREKAATRTVVRLKKIKNGIRKK